MTDIVTAAQADRAREFRALIASFEANRDLVLMGAYRSGADPQLDRAIAMHGALVDFMCQPSRSVVDAAASFAALQALLGHAA